MAESTLAQVKDQLNCSICLDTYDNPKQLMCFHVYCQDCLVKLVVRDAQGQRSLTCPTCRKVTPVPANGVQELPAAFQVNRLLDILGQSESLKSTGDMKHESDSATTSPPSQTLTSSTCADHAGKELDLFCDTCTQLICAKCTLIGSKHHGHLYSDTSVVLETARKEVAASIEPVQEKLKEVSKAVLQVKRELEAVSDQKVLIESNVHRTFENLQEIICARMERILAELLQTTEEKTQCLQNQKQQLNSTYLRMKSYLDFVDDSLQSGNLEVLLLVKDSIVSDIQELSVQFDLTALQPAKTADLTFSASADIDALCENNYGSLSASGTCDISGCHATDAVVYSELAVGTKTTANLQFAGYRSTEGKEIDLELDCELVSNINGTRVSGSVQRRGEGQYEVTFAPTIKGRHQFHVKLEGRHIRHSPFPVSADEPVKALGQVLLTVSNLEGPTGIVATQNGEILVIERGAHCISVFSYGGEKIRSFGSHGLNPGQLNSPFRMAIDGEGNYLVANCLNHRIEKFSPEGDLLAHANGAGLQMLHPKDVAFNTSNNKVYVICDADCVTVLNSNLSFLSQFGKKGNGKGCFNSPRGIACDTSGNVYVADSGNNRIQVFNEEGKFQRQIGKRGEGKGELKFPIAVALDVNGYVYVSDNYNNRIMVFSPRGQFVTHFGRKIIQHPQGIAVGLNGVVYVCDYENNCFHVF